MADNNTYTSKQNIKKYTTQAKFDAIDKSDVPVGTEYNIVGSIAESDLDSDLQAKVNLTGDGWTTEITGGKVKVKNSMNFETTEGVELHSAMVGSSHSTGITYLFPHTTPIGYYATGIVPVIGSKTITPHTGAESVTYQGLLLPNAYAENNYTDEAYALLTASNSYSSGPQIYILPYCSSSNPGISRLLSTASLEAGPGITIQNASAPGRLKISADGGGGSLPTTPSGPYAMLVASGSIGNTPTWLDIRDEKIQANFLVHDNSFTTVSYNAHETGAIFEKYATILKNGTSSDSKFVLKAPTIPNESPDKVTLLLPYKSGTLATLDDIPTGGGGGGITATELNETPSSPETITVDELKALDTGFYNASNCILKGDVDLPRGYYHLIKIKKGTDGSIIAQDQDTGDTFVLTFRLSGTIAVGWSAVVYTHNLPTFKTLFGDQSIEGTGNIDLYKHTVSITGEEESSTLGNIIIDGYIIFYSSKSLECNSLTDLQTVLGDTFVEKAFGYAMRPDTGDIFAIDYINETYVYFSGTTSDGQNGKSTVPFTMTLVDDVKTI